MKECKDIDKLLDYIGNDYGKCAYLYIDLVKYGIDNENIDVWCQEDEGGVISAVLLRYYNGMHLYSKEANYDSESVAEIVCGIMPAMLCGMRETVKHLESYLKEYKVELGHVLQLKNYTGKYNEGSKKAKRDDYRAIASLLAEDEIMGGPYGFDLLYKQLLERYDEGFGRSWFKEDEHGIVANSATYAELENIAVVSGGIVRPDCRGKGEYSRQLGSLCRDLISEGKEVISYAYGGSAEGAHYSVGFEKIGVWEKLLKV